MNKWSILLFACVAFVGCKQELERRVETKWPNEHEKLVGFYAQENGNEYKQREEKYYEDGTLEYYGGYDMDGKRHGDWKYNYPSGLTWSIGRYEHGKKAGLKKVFWPDGKIRYEGYFKHDEKSGAWKFYDKAGKVLEERNYSDDSQ